MGMRSQRSEKVPAVLETVFGSTTTLIRIIIETNLRMAIEMTLEKMENLSLMTKMKKREFPTLEMN